MKPDTFVDMREAMRRWHVGDKRTLQSRARKGEIRYMVMSADTNRPQWLFETPEACYERTHGNINN